MSGERVGVEYTVRALELRRHLVDVSVRVQGLEGPTADFVLPSWVPGSYQIRDTARAVRGFRARGHDSGQSLGVERVDKARWRVELPAGEAVVAEYRLYAHEMVNEGTDLTDHHLLLNPVSSLVYLDGHKERPVTLRLELPPGWRAFTSLDERSGQPPTFVAGSYDELADSPVDCGTPEELTTVVRGVPHRLVFCGPGSNVEPHRLESDLARLAEATMRLFGGTPLNRYTFFFHMHEASDGALEHSNSVSCVFPRAVFRPEKSYLWVQKVTAHEYFHLYNVKRIRPAVLGPFDYTREVYTRLLWAMEGTTDYYAYLLCRRAGLWDPDRFLEQLAEQIHEYLATPGRHQQSLAEASWLSWIDYYHPYEETPNQSISYYLKGLLVSWALDMEVRERTENRQSLDSVWRALWEQYGRPGRGLQEGELRVVAEQVTGVDLGAFWSANVDGVAELDFPAIAQRAGLRFEAVEPGEAELKDGEPGYLGIHWRNDSGLVRVRDVLEDGPARRGGLDPGDEVVAVDGAKITPAEFDRMLRRYPPGSPLELTVFRRGYLTRVALTTGRAPPAKYRLVRLKEPTPLARAIYESWLEAPFGPPTASAPTPPAGDAAPSSGAGTTALRP